MLLSIQDLSVAFRMGKVDGVAQPADAVKHVSFDIPENQIVALVGESGSGKSVTAMAILNLLPDNAQRAGRIKSVRLQEQPDDADGGPDAGPQSLEEEREACRTLKGSMLRQEVYADDADHPGATQEQIQRASRPYTVTEQDFTIRTLQARDNNRHAVFFTHARETLSYQYERNPTDPRIQHALTLEVDDYGNVLKQVAIGYGRRTSPLAEGWDRTRQTTALLTYTADHV